MKILIIDDHRIFCDGLKLILANLAEQPTVLEAGDAQTGIELAANTPDLDLVMLDIKLPDMDGCEALQQIKRSAPSLPVMMLTASESRHHMRRCFDAGATGYVPKSSGAAIMQGAIALVLAGGIYVPPSMVTARNHRKAENPSNGPATPHDLLTERQAEVLSHLKEGISNKRIARRLNVTEATVKAHISAILKALGVKSRVEAALFAQQSKSRPGRS